jgi:hypothetical protein
VQDSRAEFGAKAKTFTTGVHRGAQGNSKAKSPLLAQSAREKWSTHLFTLFLEGE